MTIAPTTVTDLRFAAAPQSQRRDGVIGYVSFVLGDTLRLDAVQVRRSREGRLVLAFPRRRDARGNRHDIVHPVDDQTRRAIENQVFEALGLPLEVMP